MNESVFFVTARGYSRVLLLSCLLVLTAFSLYGEDPLASGVVSAGGWPWGQSRVASRPMPVCEPSVLDSPYIPVDNWMYPAVLRLFSLGFVDSAYLGMRPWTRSSVEHMLEEAGARIEDADAGASTDEGDGIYEALIHARGDELRRP